MNEININILKSLTEIDTPKDMYNLVKNQHSNVILSSPEFSLFPNSYSYSSYNEIVNFEIINYIDRMSSESSSLKLYDNGIRINLEFEQENISLTDRGNYITELPLSITNEENFQLSTLYNEVYLEMIKYCLQIRNNFKKIENTKSTRITFTINPQMLALDKGNSIHKNLINYHKSLINLYNLKA